MQKFPVAVVGASGYSGEELVRLLLRHPYAQLTAVTSRQYSGHTIAQVFPRFASYPLANTLRFTAPDVETLSAAADIVFLALPHGVAAEFAEPLLKQGRRVIDLSADFRLHSAERYREFYDHEHPAPQLLAKAVYGLPEIHGDAVRNAQLIASPGCYPTSILLPLIPLLRKRLVQPQGIIADSLSGVSGAGRKAELPYLFCECNESLRPYGIPKHRHLSEIEEQLGTAAGTDVVLQFTPHLVPVNRGILTTLYLNPTHNATGPSATTLSEAISQCYAEAYATAPFVRVLDAKSLPDTKNVVGTNMIELAWRVDPRTGRLIVLSAVDNVLKGAGGQAVQSMNLMMNLPETSGLV